MLQVSAAVHLIEKDVQTQDRVFDAIAHLESVYPGFGAWYHTKVVPGLLDGSRNVLFREAGSRVSAVAIAKQTKDERKLCTLWIDPNVRGDGEASTLAEEAFAWLGTKKPLFTVPDLRLHDFKALLSKWNFNETQIMDDLYRPNSKEHVFNGVLLPPS